MLVVYEPPFAERTAMTTFDLAQVDHLLSTTRAVRKRLDLSRPVPRDVVLDCIRVATQAPTGGNVQRWRWLVVDDADKHAALADMYHHWSAPYIAEHKRAIGRAGGVNDATRKIVDSSTYLAEHLHEVPVHVIPCALDRLPAGMLQGQVAGFYGSILPHGVVAPARLAGPGLGLRVDDVAPRLRGRSLRAARHPHDRHPGRAHPCRLLHRHGLQAGAAAPRRGSHLLQRLATSATELHPSSRVDVR